MRSREGVPYVVPYNASKKLGDAVARRRASGVVT